MYVSSEWLTDQQSVGFARVAWVTKNQWEFLLSNQTSCWSYCSEKQSEPPDSQISSCGPSEDWRVRTVQRVSWCPPQSEGQPVPTSRTARQTLIQHCRSLNGWKNLPGFSSLKSCKVLTHFFLLGSTWVGVDRTLKIIVNVNLFRFSFIWKILQVNVSVMENQSLIISHVKMLPV